MKYEYLHVLQKYIRKEDHQGEKYMINFKPD